ncbi:carbohydrate kinase family protein [Halocynthiibacter sp.]|uniref:carbohydrate kinase family protein n=1 Tax=Halocynthiibacter sp. TaxID=1979210 RepID=UPI003C44EC56
MPEHSNQQDKNPPLFAIGGENLIDHVTNDGQVTAKVGGSPFNVAMGLGRQGANVRYISPISNDPWGGKLAAALVDAGVDLTGGRVNLPTTMARVEITSGIPSYRFEREGTAERDITFEGLVDQLTDASALHTGSLTLTKGDDAGIWERALAHAFDAGMFVSLDPNVRMSVIEDVQVYRKRIFRIVQKISMIKLSDEDLADLYPDQSQDDALHELTQHSSAALIVLTKGREGALAITRHHRVQIKAAPVQNLVDAVGAGDTFAATLLMSLSDMGCLSAERINALTEDQVISLLNQASIAAAINCGREGCDPPTRSELLEAVR